jgi:transcriptional regulator of arginine metabolism
MSKLAIDNLSARRALIIELIEDGLIHSQTDLVKYLAKGGFKVTQATASRDLEELGAVRGKDSNGVFRYQFISPAEVVSNNLTNLLISIDSSANLAVAKTPPGAAQLLAAHIDRGIKAGKLAGIGCIAGDDTIMIISKSPSGGAALAKAIDRFISDSGSMKRIK